MLIAGAVITVVALIVGVTSAVIVTQSAGRPLYEGLTNPSRATPMDEQLSLRAGRYTVFELAGRQTTRGPVTTESGNDAPPVNAEDVQITAPDGSPIAVSEPGSSREEITRGTAVYSGAIRFSTPAAGTYRVRISTPSGAQVVIAPALGSGLRAALPWLGTGFVSGLVLIVGLILIIAGVVRRHRQPVTKPAWNGGVPAKGWYPAPDVPGRQRYWDGQAWTEYLR